MGIFHQISSCARFRLPIQMPLHMTSSVRSAVSFLVVALVYWLSLWRIIKSNRGNRVIECGSITLMLLFLMMLLMKVTNLPEWLIPSLGLLLFLLCLLTMFFLLLQGIQALRHRKSKATASSFSITDQALHELGYDPANLGQKWMLRIVYCGTVLLVAFILWEYVKAR